MKSHTSIIAAGVLFLLGATGGVLSVVAEGSVLSAIASILGYCGAGYYIRDYLASSR
jgi:hypothetical protein